MGTNPTTNPAEEIFLAGTFATVFGFTASPEDLLAGMETTKVELRFFIDEAAKEPYAVLMDVTDPDHLVAVEPSDYAGGFQIMRRLRHGMTSARGANKARSTKKGFEGTGKAMAYTSSAADNSDEREYVEALDLGSLRAAVETFTNGRHFPEDFKNRWGKIVRTAKQQANDAVLIFQYLDQRGI